MVKSSIIRTLLVHFGGVFVASTLLIGYLWINSEYENLQQESDFYHQEFIANQKSILSSEVHKIKAFLLAEKAKAEALLEDQIKSRTEEAYAIAAHLYTTNLGRLSDQEIQRNIVEALRTIRFNDGRGYYFITSLNEVEHLFPPNPSFEGKVAGDVFSAEGVKVVNDIITIAQEAGEGFYRYDWPRPDDQSRLYKKYSYVKLFEPYGWIIGTGDYLAEVEEGIKRDIFKKIANLKYGMNDEGYFFINSYTGDLYVTNGRYYGGTKNIWDTTDINGKKVVQENSRLAQTVPEGGFTEYVWKKTTGSEAAKISYILGMDEWGIFIGTGAYIDTIEVEVAQREKMLELRLKKRVADALWVLLGATLMIILATYFIARKLALNFSAFQNVFDKAADNRIRIDTDRIFFSEFKVLADRSNSMIDTLNQQAEKLRHQAYHDDLTALPNRVKGLEHLSQMIEKGVRNKTMLALLFIDIDDFKEINDTLGHTIGDHLIASVSMRLVHAVRENDAVARLGGDEFMVITDMLHCQSEAGVVAEKLLHALNDPFVIEDSQLHISASIGISIYPNDGADAETILRNADSAMYHAKRAGKNNFVYYHDDMTQQAAERVEIVDDLRVAISEEQFELYFQPQIDIIKGSTVGVEALIRWNHPAKGMVCPDQFIPFSESSGLILPIGEWVLRQACKQLAEWQKEGYGIDYIAVNISGKQLQQNFPELVMGILDETGLPPNALELEITETIVMESSSSVIGDLVKLKELGVGLSIDDFGTGYSSLSYLKQLPINKLKIDRSFVRDLEVDENDRVIVKAIIGMGHSLNLIVVAEGVETQAQLDLLKHEGCYLIQGYHYSRPLPAQNIPNFLGAFTI